LLHGSHDQVEVLDLVVPQQVVVCEHDSGFIGARGITPPKGFAGDGSCNEKEQTPLKKLKYNHVLKAGHVFSYQKGGKGTDNANHK
jgi:hypothetical protein